MLRQILSAFVLLAIAPSAAMAQTQQIQPTQPYTVDQLQTQPYTGTPQQQTQPLAAQQGAAQLRATHGSWEVRCVNQTDCIMTQFHRRTPSTADAVFTILRPSGLTDPQGAPIEALAEIVVPLGVYIPNGLGLQVDAGEPRAAPYERCVDDGCVVRAPISSNMLNQLKAGGTAYLVLSGSPRETVRVPIPLNGFTAAFNELQ